jgi:glycosyltransferase involved in cell wall biosynthesis
MNKIAFIASITPEKITGPLNSVTKLCHAIDSMANYQANAYSVEKIDKSFHHNKILVRKISFLNFLGICKKYDHYIFTNMLSLRVMLYAIILLLLNRSVVMSPRGNLVEGALSYKKFKKKIFLTIFKPFLANMTFHFLSKSEYLNSRRLSKKYFICPNIQESNEGKSIDYTKRKKEIIYIGRYDIHHKGLDLMIDYIFKNKDVLEELGYKVKMFGPSRNNGHEWIKSQIDKKGLNDIISLCSEIVGHEKNKTLQESRIFIHTSRYEGVPQAIIEAMQFGCKIIASNECNLDDKILISSNLLIYNNSTLGDLRRFIKEDAYVSDVDWNYYSSKNVAQIFSQLVK